MYRQLFPKEKFPDGHLALAVSINDLGFLNYAAGNNRKAKRLFREALVMNRQLLRQYAELAAEAESLNFAAGQPNTIHGLLSTQRQRPDDPALYDALWDSRAVLTRLQERRHHDLMASHDKATADLADELRLARHSLARLVLKLGPDADAHRKEIEKLTQAKEDLEKRIAAKLRLPAPRPAPITPLKQLSAALPADAAFVDLIRYNYIEFDLKKPGIKGEKQTPSYVAFVVCKGQPTACVELKDASTIDQAWTAWRKTLTAARPDMAAERAAAAELARLVWAPIRAKLPARCQTVYLTPSGPLTQVPWSALPGRKADSVLLDECAVCLVPHWPWLLNSLQQKPAQRRGDTLLVYGGVDYGNPPKAIRKGDDVRAPRLGKKRVRWPDLPGTERERSALAALASNVLKDRPIVRGGRAASTAQLVEDLPKARYAHVATHGFFADPEFQSALQLDPRMFDYRSPDLRGGGRSPLVLSGLVLAGANRRGGRRGGGGRRDHHGGGTDRTASRGTGVGGAVGLRNRAGGGGGRGRRLRFAACLPRGGLSKRGGQPVEGGRRGNAGANGVVLPQPVGEEAGCSRGLASGAADLVPAPGGGGGRTAAWRGLPGERPAKSEAEARPARGANGGGVLGGVHHQRRAAGEVR
jgi:hypothetical protein